MEPIKKILLIVDNDEDWLALLKMFLQGQGYEVVPTQDYAGAIKAAELVFPHCAIVDLKLGNEDGLSVCRYIKASPALKNVPVIMLSGLDGLPEGSGCDAFVCKAEGIERLLSVINKLLSGK
jgi:DNA-binding response OmpR family regulator